MHIHLVVPVITDVMNQAILSHCEKVCSPGTRLTISNIADGTESVESLYDEELGAKDILREAKKAADSGADGVIIYCFGNPAIDAAKEMLDIPVIGIGEASQALAMPLCENFGIVTTIKNAVSRNKKKAKLLGTDSKLGAVIPLGLKVTELTGNKDELMEKISCILEKQIEDKELDLLILGCGYLVGYADVLSQKLGVPVIDPGSAAVKLMEAYVTMGLAQSKISYMTPPAKNRTCVL